MDNISVSVVAATAEARLYPHYQNGIGILTLRAGMPRPCPTGINIDTSLILDFDAEGLLTGVELMDPMRTWKGKASTSRPHGPAGNILLKAPHAGSIEYREPFVVSFDVQTEAGRIGFGRADYTHAVELSPRCYAPLLEDDLTGFWFSLAR